MRILFITQKTPFGDGEAFVLNELVEFSKRIDRLVIIPMRPGNVGLHSDAASILGNTIARPLFSWLFLLSFLRRFVRRPIRCLRVFAMLLASRSLKKFAKNLAILPKSFWIAEVIDEQRLDHIHAYWASTSASAALFASILTRVSWTFTCYRWDIAENNLLREKVSSAAFGRVADDHGLAEILSIVGDRYRSRVFTARSGVVIPAEASRSRQLSTMRIAVPASFVEKKGHRYLLEALAELMASKMDFFCHLIGDGPKRGEIIAAVSRLRLGSHVFLCGMLDHAELNARYVRGEYDVVVLPSIVTADMEREGIPVSLIEAMAAGIPVISTRTGGIPELVGPGCGILVEQRNSDQLAAAIRCLAADHPRMLDIAKHGRARVIEQYDVRRIVALLLSRMEVIPVNGQIGSR